MLPKMGLGRQHPGVGVDGQTVEIQHRIGFECLCDRPCSLAEGWRIADARNLPRCTFMETLIPAFGYLRTSSATNVGDDKDSDKRQKAAIEGAATASGHYVKQWFYDADVKGETPVNERPALMLMLNVLVGNGVRTVFVEDVGRFSRVVTVGMLGLPCCDGWT
jgi:hypothetical protein